MIDALNDIRMVIAYVLITLIFLGVIFILLLSSKGRSWKIGVIGIVGIFGSAFLLLILNVIITQMSLSEMYKELKMAEKNNSLVLINGKNPTFEIKELFEEIRNRDFLAFRNRAHNTDEFKIDIIRKLDTFSISLFRDSRNSNKYWIYNNNHEYELDLGSMRSRVLKDLKE